MNAPDELDAVAPAARRYQLWTRRLAESESEVERLELRLSRVLGRLLAARKRARTYRRKLEAAELEALEVKP